MATHAPDDRLNEILGAARPEIARVLWLTPPEEKEALVQQAMAKSCELWRSGSVDFAAYLNAIEVWSQGLSASALAQENGTCPSTETRRAANGLEDFVGCFLQALRLYLLDEERVKAWELIALLLPAKTIRNLKLSDAADGRLLK